MYIRPVDMMFAEDNGWIGDHSCPICGGMVNVNMVCPGYGTPVEEGGRGVSVCWPPSSCSNATEYRCLGQPEDLGEGCGWWYRTPNKRGDKDKMGEPVWWATDINDDIARFNEAQDAASEVILVGATVVEAGENE